MVLSGVFIVSGVAKVRDLMATVTAAEALGVPLRLTRAVARFLPAAELSIAVALIAGLFWSPVRRAGAFAAIALLGVFTFAMARALARGNAPICHCFGSLSSRPINAESVVRNGALVALGLVVAVG